MKAKAEVAATWYLATVSDETSRKKLRGTCETEVCVVGGGLAGLTTALELIGRGRDVVVLEAGRLGRGASGRNGGFVEPGYSQELSALERRVGVAAAANLYRLSLEGVEIVRGNLAAPELATVQRTDGLIGVVRYDPGDALRCYRDRMAENFSRRLVWLDRESVGERLRSPRYCEGLYDPDGFHIHPLNYVLALARRIETLGGAVYEHCPAVTVDLSAAEKTVRTDDGTVRCRDVVFAGGGYADELVPRLRRSMLPIATYMVVTEPDAELIRTAINTEAGISDDRRASDYYRVVDGGRRLLWGGRITTRTTLPRRLGERLRRTMADTYPQLAGLGIDSAWSGLMAYARHRMPQIGPLGPGAWMCTGFGGHGINTTAIGGRLVAEAITGQSDRYRLFEPFGLAWNGGPAGRAAAQLTYWWLRAADWWRERAI